MTINESATLLLNDFSPEEREIPDATDYPGRNAAVINAMNSALQELFGEGSPWVRKDEIGLLANASTTVTISVTNGSASATVTSGWASWMAGCTIQIDGSTIDNQIRNASSTATLKYPYDGTTGSKSATVYHDSFTVPSSVMRVLDPVRYCRRRLSAVETNAIDYRTRTDEDYGYDHQFANLPVPDRIDQTTGTPVAYTVQTWSTGDATQPGYRIQILPASAEAGNLDFHAMLAPPLVDDLTSTDTLPIPMQFTQSIFYPVARKHLSGSPFFVFSASSEEIQRSYQEALRLFERLKPGRNRGRVTRSVY